MTALGATTTGLGATTTALGGVGYLLTTAAPLGPAQPARYTSNSLRRRDANQ
jgi:hypothetical protein